MVASTSDEERFLLVILPLLCVGDGLSGSCFAACIYFLAWAGLARGFLCILLSPFLFPRYPVLPYILATMRMRVPSKRAQ